MRGIREYVEAGGLMSYGPNVVDQHRRAAESTNVTARTLGLHTHVIHASTERNFDAAFATLLQVHSGVLPPIRSSSVSAISSPHWRSNMEFPRVNNLREFAKAGGLMSYGTSVTEASRQAGLFARLGSAHENACGIVPRPSLQPLHQALQQPGARLDRREEHVFMIRVCAGAVDAQSIERWDAHRDREIAVRSAADERRPL